MGQPVGAGSAYGLRRTLAWPVTWPAPLKSRYVTWGEIQVLYSFAFCLCRKQTTFVARGVAVHDNEVSSARKTSHGIPIIQWSNLTLFQFCFVLLLVQYIDLNDVQMASTKHAYDTPHHDLGMILHALDNTALSETFSRHATDLLHLLVLALNDALNSKYHLHSTRSLCCKPSKAWLEIQRNSHWANHFQIIETIKCKLITYPCPVFYSPYLKFICPSFHQLRQFLILERSTNTHCNYHELSVHWNWHNGYDAIVQSWLPVALLSVFAHQKVISSCCHPCSPTSTFHHWCQLFISRHFMRIPLTDEALTFLYKIFISITFLR